MGAHGKGDGVSDESNGQEMSVQLRTARASLPDYHIILGRHPRPLQSGPALPVTHATPNPALSRFVLKSSSLRCNSSLP